MASRISKITLYKCPLDKSYNHTIYFEDEAQQVRYFNQLPKLEFNNLSVCRIATTVFRVQAYFEDLLQYNYLSFENPSSPSSTTRGKKFYAFLDKVEYHNDNTTDLYYTVDVMQTYYFDYDLGECFVERENVIDDDYFVNNTIEEGLETGEMRKVYESDITLNSVKIGFCTTINLNALPTFNTDPTGSDRDVCFIKWQDNSTSDYILYQNINGTWKKYNTDSATGKFEYHYGENIGNVFSGYHIYYVSLSDASAFGDLLSGFSGSGQADAVKQIVIVPTEILSEHTPKTISFKTKDTGGYIGKHSFEVRSGTISNRTVRKTITPSSFYPYTYHPKNNKLYTSEFFKIGLFNNEGGYVELKIEEFINASLRVPTSSINLDFLVDGTIGADSAIRITPVNYGEDQLLGHPSRLHSLQQSNYPLGSWAYSMFDTWFAQNRNNINNQYLTSGLRTATSAVAVGVAVAAMAKQAAKGGASFGAVGAVAGGAIGLAEGIAGVGAVTAKIKDQEIVPNSVGGQLGNTNINLAQDTKKTVLQIYRPKLEFVKIIDEFLSAYGYKIHRIKKPNLTTAYSYSVESSDNRLRPFYNYIKTQNCVIHQKKDNGTVRGIPSDAEAQIAKIYDNGITFWNNEVLFNSGTSATLFRPRWLFDDEYTHGSRTAKFPIEIGDYSVDNTQLRVLT